MQEIDKLNYSNVVNHLLIIFYSCLVKFKNYFSTPRHALSVLPTNKSASASAVEMTTSNSRWGRIKFLWGYVDLADKILVGASARQSRARLIVTSNTRLGSPLATNPPRGWYRSSLIQTQRFSYIKRLPQGHRQ